MSCQMGTAFIKADNDFGVFYKEEMKRINALLVALISSLTITGVSLIDDQIWKGVFLAVGTLSYTAVGGLFSIGFLYGRRAGKLMYLFVFFLLLFIGWAIYQGLLAFGQWVQAWPLWIKIVVPFSLAIAVAATVISIFKKRSHKDDGGPCQSAESAIERPEETNS